MELNISTRSVVTERVVTLLIVSLIGLTGCSIPTDGSTDDPTVASDPGIVGNVREYEYAVALAACMVERGWDVEADGAGGWGVVYDSPPEEQRALMEAEFEECRESAWGLTRGSPEEEANYAFDNIARVVDCLGDRGFDTPTGPDRGRFVQLMLSEFDDVIWDPYELVPKDRMREAVLGCPQ